MTFTSVHTVVSQPRVSVQINLNIPLLYSIPTRPYYSAPIPHYSGHSVTAAFLCPHTVTPAPLQPPNLTVVVINSTSLSLSWIAPPPSMGHTLSSYDVLYIEVGGAPNKQRVGAEQLAVTLTSLAPGSTYIINVSAVYVGNILGPVVSKTVTLQRAEPASIVNQPWFYAVVGIGGTVLLVCAIILAACICYQCRKTRLYKGQPKSYLAMHSRRHACPCSR